MLTHLHIRNIAIIESIEVEFQPGLNLMTGETGAGKSIIIDSFGLALGNRASADLIRAGESSAEVSAVFSLTPNMKLDALLEEYGLEHDGELILRRTITASGGSRAFINGSPVTLVILKEFGDRLVSVHGQGEGDELLKPAGQLAILDAYAGIEAQVEEIREVWAQLKQAKDDLSRISADVSERHRQRDFLQFQIAEIEKAAISTEEEQELIKELAVLENAERLKLLSGQSYYQVYESEESLVEQVSKFEAILQEIGEISPEWLEKRELIESARLQIQEVARELGSFSDTIEADPKRLQQVEDRLSVYNSLQKKYGNTTQSVLDTLAKLQHDLSLLQADDSQMAELESLVSSLDEEYGRIAQFISNRRRQAIDPFSRAIETHLAHLAMDKASFDIAMSEHPRGRSSTGVDRVEFLLQANPGSSSRPLSKVASGGEQSRIMLAIKSVALGERVVTTMIFDEIDAGIGGKVAEFVGQKLKSIAADHQVLCITHLAQVAAAADNHHVIEKSEAEEMTTVKLRQVTEQNRVEELARMLAGEVVSESSRSLARELIQNAQSAGSQGL